MCACASLWAKMSQKSVTSVALFAPKAEINVFFIVHASKEFEH